MTPPLPLSLAEFQQLIEAYGAEPSRWPEAIREAGQQTVAASAEARRLLEREAMLDALLAADVPQPPSAALRGRVASIPLSHPQRSEWRWLWPFESWWRPLAALTAAATFGLLVGLRLPTATVAATALPSASSESSLAVGDDTLGEDWSEQAGLAFATFLEGDLDG